MTFRTSVREKKNPNLNANFQIYNNVMFVNVSFFFTENKFK